MSDPLAHGVLLTVSYVGTEFSGYARQDNARTIAGELETAIRIMAVDASRVRGASRTDAGVHAAHQMVCFDTNADISSHGWVMGLNKYLPDAIAIRRAARVRAGYEPRYGAKRKTYRYSLLRSRLRDPFLHATTWRVYERLNQQLMRNELASLIGTHDFRGFRDSGDERIDTNRTLDRVEVVEPVADARRSDIVIRGNRFLYHMMRIIAGTAVDVARGKLPPGTIAAALESGDRTKLGMTAPAHGLCLEQVELDDHGIDAWPFD